MLSPVLNLWRSVDWVKFCHFLLTRPVIVNTGLSLPHSPWCRATIMISNPTADFRLWISMTFLTLGVCSTHHQVWISYHFVLLSSGTFSARSLASLRPSSLTTWTQILHYKHLYDILYILPNLRWK